MGLYGDIQELTPYWKRAPWRVKIFLGISLFLAVSSLASLSEDVANWKGFFFTGLQFYQAYFRDPVFSFISKLLPLSFTAKEADTMTLILLISVAYTRGYIFEYQTKKSKIDKFSIFVLMAILNSCIIAFFIILGIENGSLVNQQSTLYLIIGLYCVSAIFTLIPTPDKGAKELLTQIYLFLPPIIVCIAAAINLGLRSN